MKIEEYKITKFGKDSIVIYEHKRWHVYAIDFTCGMLSVFPAEDVGHRISYNLQLHFSEIELEKNINGSNN